MKPIDFRNATWKQVQSYVTGMRQLVYEAWRSYEMKYGKGGATTLMVSSYSNIGILNLRPRTTELYQLGAIRLADIQDMKGTEGRYVTRSEGEWQQWFKDGGGEHNPVPKDLIQPELL